MVKTGLSQLSDLSTFISLTWPSIDNDLDTDHGPASKKRKTASVLVDQPAESDKMVVDQVTDVSATFEEVIDAAIFVILPLFILYLKET